MTSSGAAKKRRKLLQNCSVAPSMLKMRMTTFAVWTLNDPKAQMQEVTPKFMKNIRKPLVNVETFQTQTMNKEFKTIAMNAVEITNNSENVVNAVISNSTRVSFVSFDIFEAKIRIKLAQVLYNDLLLIFCRATFNWFIEAK